MTMRTRRVAWIVAAAALAATALTTLTIGGSFRWIGTIYPGFFVLPNRVITASPGWIESSTGRLAQRQVLAVDGTPVTNAAAIDDAVRRRPAGSLVHYTLRAADGTVTDETAPSRVFTAHDYALLFAPFLLNGALFMLIGLTVFALKPRRPASLALLCTGLVTGLFATTISGVGGSWWHLRLHVLAAALLPATLLHLALVFPKDRIRDRRSSLLAALYLPFLVLTIGCELSLQQLTAYVELQRLTTVSAGLACVVVVASIVHELLTSKALLVRRRVAVVALGAGVGLLLSIIQLTASSLFGGQPALNAAAFTAFFLPLSVGYAILKHDPFEIDLLLQRTLTSVALIVGTAAAYFGILYVCALRLPADALLTHSPAVLALLNLGMLLLIAPLHIQIQRAIDRLAFRRRYDTESALVALSRGLAAVRTVDDVISRVREVLRGTVGSKWVELYRREQKCWVRCPAGAEDRRTLLILPRELVTRLECGTVLTRYEWDDGSGGPLPAIWRELDAELAVPIPAADSLGALLVLGPKRSGRAYALHDVTFLRSAANQISLAFTNATAFGQMRTLNHELEELNLNLEQQVRERTATSEAANQELTRSLQELQVAYQQLKQNQTTLVRADRLATLGRLTAGIAHEMNTPLTAVLNAHRVLADLAHEYQSSIRDPDVLAEDHEQIAQEMITTLASASEWATKAAAYIRSVKAHGREPQHNRVETFAVGAVVAEIRALLAHRLRAASCPLEYSEDPAGVELHGDASRLSQVLVNLITNAIDAHEEAGITGESIELQAAQRAGVVTISVRDHAAGIPPQILPHIFEELFTTKGAGRGTGLGLWISRNLVEQGFGGTLDVLTASGLGSCFSITIPTRETAPSAQPATPLREQPAEVVALSARRKARKRENVGLAATG